MFRNAIFAAVSACLVCVGSASAQDGAGGFVSEIKGGVLLHDVGRGNETKNAEENTIDINAEILFDRITLIDTGNDLLNLLVQPRPHIGGQVNTGGWTNHGYFGITWDYQFEAGPFIEFAFGFGVHDGQLKGPSTRNTDRPNLGSRVLFREGLDLGWRFAGGHSLAVHGSHLSNGGVFAKENDGMNFLGVRYGYRFD